MNFFAHQDEARSQTRKLVFLFIAAVITLILLTSFLVIALFFVAETQDTGLSVDMLGSELFLGVTTVVVAVVALGTMFRLVQLSGGGKAVAEALGGRLLNTSTRDPDERKILNVVEEMAIASGTPVPSVYLMEEQSINAFAAGYKARDAVIGVTRGCIRELDRDELQGVIAHEFSHIFNGDMRLNIRLMGLLYGIMVLGIIGYHILRSSRYQSGSKSSKNNGGGIIFLGLGLMVIGYGGTFFGNIIKAAVSRQREFLADASAVQYTRNPDGISGALKKIGGYPRGSEIVGEDASEISHMLFCDGIKHSFSSMFATHPPLKERIERIDPFWKGATAGKSNHTEMSAGEGVLHFAGQGGSTGSALDSIGNPSAENLSRAASTLAAIPALVLEEAHNSMSATLMIYSLLISLSDEQMKYQQMQLLQKELEEKDFHALDVIRKEVDAVRRDDYLALVDLAIPSLRQLSKVQHRFFMNVLGKLIMEDNEILLFEWCLFKILRYSLDDRPDRRQKYRSLKALHKECEALLSVLVSSGHTDEAGAKSAFMAAKEYLKLNMGMQYRHNLGANTGQLEKALDNLNTLKPLEKPKLLKAMVATINADGKVTAQEAELLRAVGSLLDCPIPPLLPKQRFM